MNVVGGDGERNDPIKLLSFDAKPGHSVPFVLGIVIVEGYLDTLGRVIDSQELCLFKIAIFMFDNLPDRRCHDIEVVSERLGETYQCISSISNNITGRRSMVEDEPVFGAS